MYDCGGMGDTNKTERLILVNLVYARISAILHVLLPGFLPNTHWVANYNIKLGLEIHPWRNILQIKITMPFNYDIACRLGYLKLESRKQFKNKELY